MSQVTKMLPAFFPKVKIEARVQAGRRFTVRSLCETAGLVCRVTGPSSERIVFLRKTDDLDVSREPGPMGRVSIGVPKCDVEDSLQPERAILVLGVMAYAVFDYASRESMRGRPESRTSLPVGRPRKRRTLSGAERTRGWRRRRLAVQSSP